MVEPCAFWKAGGAACPHNGHRIGCLKRYSSTKWISARCGGQGTIEREAGRALRRDVFDLGGAQPWIDAGGNAACANDCLIRNRVVDAAGQLDADDIALGNAVGIDEPARQCVGLGGPLGKRQPSTFVHIRFSVAVFGNDFVEQIDNGGKVAGNWVHQKVSTPRAIVPLSRP